MRHENRYDCVCVVCACLSVGLHVNRYVCVCVCACVRVCVCARARSHRRVRTCIRTRSRAHTHACARSTVELVACWISIEKPTEMLYSIFYIRIPARSTVEWWGSWRNYMFGTMVCVCGGGGVACVHEGRESATQMRLACDPEVTWMCLSRDSDVTRT